MRVGDRIMRKLNQQGGYIVAARKQTSGVYMVRVRWDNPDETQWLPSEEIMPWDKLQTPPIAKKTPWGRTTPAYLVELRRDLRQNPEKASQPIQTKADLTRLTNQLLDLSNKRKNRSRMKAKRIVAQYYKESS